MSKRLKVKAIKIMLMDTIHPIERKVYFKQG